MKKQTFENRIVDPNDIVKDNLKKFNSTIQKFNDRLKNASKKGKISNDTYNALYIDKRKKDFYKANIFTKRQFNSFVKELDKLNNNTMKLSKRGIGFENIPVTRYEYQLYKKRFKYLLKYDEEHNTDFSDIAFNAKAESKIEAISKLQTIELVYKNKTKRFMKNFKTAYEFTFNADFDFKKRGLTEKDIKTLIKNNPMFRISLIYDDTSSKRERKKMIDNMIKDYQENKKDIINSIGKQDEDAELPWVTPEEYHNEPKKRKRK